MIRKKIVKWVAAGALALGAVPAISLARHSSHVSADMPSLSAVQTVKPATASKTSPRKLVSHGAKSTAHTSKLSTHSTKLTSHKKATPARKSSHKRSTKRHTTTHRGTHSTKKSTTSKKHS